MDRITLDEIMKLDSNCDMVKGNSMILMSRFVPISLEIDEKYKPYYSVKVSDVLSSNMQEGDLIKMVMEGGWAYSSDKEFLHLYI